MQIRAKQIATAAAVSAGGLLLADQLYRRSQTPTSRMRHAYDSAYDTAYEAASDHLTLIGSVAGVAFLIAGGWLLSNYLRSSHRGSFQSSVEESIELDVPVRVAYNQWTQFEDFPKFMATVEEVKQINDTHLRWKANVGGKAKEWEAEITEQIPDKRIAWRSTTGTRNAGVVSFHKIGENRTRVMLQMDYEPDGMDERAADMVGGVKLTTKANLRRFKQLVEQRGVETGAWRGTVPQTSS